MKLNRRRFVEVAGMSAAGFGLISLSGCAAKKGEAPRQRVAFNTANLVARFTGYRYELKNWGQQHQKTVAMTDAKAWEAICREIAAAGFRAVEVWEAHASPESLDRHKAAEWKSILQAHGLRPVAYAGGLRPETLQVCQWLEIPHVDGGLRDQTPDQGAQLCRAFGIRFNLENHPEKTAEDALAKIGGGNEWLGLCVDTGWFGTQGANVPQTIRACRGFIRHTHIKDVKAAGTHETCMLGDGVVDVAGSLRALREVGYTGWYSWEDEPEDRNPFDSAARNRRFIAEKV